MAWLIGRSRFPLEDHADQACTGKPTAASLASTPHMKHQRIRVVFVSRSESEIDRGSANQVRVAGLKRPFRPISHLKRRVKGDCLGAGAFASKRRSPVAMPQQGAKNDFHKTVKCQRSQG
jgi:hypothetical protein